MNPPTIIRGIMRMLQLFNERRIERREHKACLNRMKQEELHAKKEFQKWLLRTPPPNEFDPHFDRQPFCDYLPKAERECFDRELFRRRQAAHEREFAMSA